MDVKSAVFLGVETEARRADMATTAKIFAELAPAGSDTDPSETNTTYEAIVNTFNQHPDQVFRAREVHELLDMPTDEASLGITRRREGQAFGLGGYRRPPGPTPQARGAVLLTRCRPVSLIAAPVTSVRSR